MISLEFDVRAFVNHATVFIRESVGDRVAVFGLSGGLDSTTVAYLLARSLPKDRVLAVLMHEERDEDYSDAAGVAAGLGIRRVYVPISLPEFLRSEDLVVAGNAKARLRMAILYRMANELGGIVVGTSNKTELLVGYFTKRGDGAADIYPLADLYKTQVRRLAEYLGVPEKIRLKRPSAGLRPGQFDEEELGIDYDALDAILRGLELLYTPREIAEELGIDLGTVLRVLRMVRSTRHKRRPKPLRSSARCPMFDRREPGYRSGKIAILGSLETISSA